MPAPFGLSVGDVITVSILIKDVFKALDDPTGAVAEYQERTNSKKMNHSNVRLKVAVSFLSTTRM